MTVPTSISESHKAALWYARRSLFVFPVHSVTPAGTCTCRNPDCANIGKHPRTQHGFQDATTDVETINRWWTMWPEANVAIACEPSNLAVIDVDINKGGDESLHDLEARHGKLPDTVRQLTGGGGAHIIFELPKTGFRSRVAIAPGLDTRGNGGYIVATPSNHESGGSYVWEVDRQICKFPLAQVPQWFLDLMGEAGGTTERVNTADVLNGVAQGDRDYQLFRLAAKFRQADLPIDIAYQLISTAAANCSPPFALQDARKKVESAYRYAPGQDAIIAPAEALRATSSANEPIDWPTFWATDHKAEDWLLEPVIPRGRSIALYAPAKAGKSLFALKLMACLATGRTVLDQPGGEPIDVVYFDLEMTETDLYERLESMGYGPETDLSHLHYYLLPSLPALDTPAGGTAVLDIVSRHTGSVVVIDTTSRVLGGPENDADTLRALYICTFLPLKAAGKTIIRLDHAGKDLERGQRGTSAKNDDVDLVWQLTHQDDGIQLRATHRRQSWIPEVVNLSIHDDPLRYVMVDETWPAGTKDAAARLERLNLEQTCTVRQARQALKDAGATMQSSLLSAAVKWRKKTFFETRNMEPEESGTRRGTRFSGQNGTDDGTGGNQIRGTQTEHGGTGSAERTEQFRTLSAEQFQSVPKKHRRDEDWE